MIKIEYLEKLNDKLYEMIDDEFNKYAEMNGLKCNYRMFNFIAKDNEKVIGIINGHSYYDEIHIGDFIVLEEYRRQHIGTMLMKKVEELYKDEDFDNFNLSTFEFQAPKFYEKMEYKLEYIRKNNKNPKLNKYFYSKSKDKLQ